MLQIIAAKILLYIVSFFKGDKYRYSQQYEDNFKYMDLQEKLWWGYKALIKQIERAEKGKGIEDYFAAQDLTFKAPADFQVEQTATITAGGDLSAADVVYPESTEHLWDDIEEFFFSGDIVCANLEAPLDSQKPMSGVPTMCLSAPDLNTSPAMFNRFYRGGKGVNFFSTANNHSVDQGEEGLVATLDFLDEQGCQYVGTARTPEEQMDIPVIEKNGIKIAFLSYTYCLNGYDPIPGKEYMTNVIRLNKPETDISLIEEHVRIAREKEADLIVAMLHWSVEFETYPLQNIIDMGHRVMELGIDVILGGHPHVAQPMEKYTFYDPYLKQEKEGFIIYSLGELVSYNAFSKNSRLAFTLKLELARGQQGGKEVSRITGLEVLPIYTWVRRFKNGEADYRLLDFLKLIDELDRGINRHGFSDKEVKELKRLERLLTEKLLPQEKGGLLTQTGV